MTHPTVTCGTCEGSGITPEDHGQGMIEYLGCQDCMALGQFKMVPVDGVVLSRQPCNNCEGTGTVHKDKPGIRDDYPFPCPSCGGSGTTWPDELIEAVCQGYEKFAEMEAMADVLVPLIELAPLVLDALALVVQEGEAT